MGPPPGGHKGARRALHLPVSLGACPVLVPSRDGCPLAPARERASLRNETAPGPTVGGSPALTRIPEIPMDTLQLQAVIDALAEGVVLAGPDQRIQFVNQAFARITGFDAEAAAGQPLEMMQGAGSDPVAGSALATAVAGGEPFHGQLLAARRSGEKYWNDLRVVPTRDEASQPSGYFGILRDVTEQRKLEADYQALERHGQYLLDHAQAGIVLHKADTTIVYANQLACELLGVGPDNIIGAINTDPRWGFLARDGGRMEIEDYPVNAAVRTRAIVKDLMLGIRRVSDDALVWLMCTAYPKVEMDGAITHVLVTFTDVTELKKAQDSLERSQERLQLVLRGSNDAAWDWDLVADEIYYSPRWMEMLGYREGELEVDSGLWRRMAHPKDRTTVTEFLDGVLAGPLSSYEVEFRMRHQRGHYVPLLSRGFVLRDGSGRAIRISGTNTDLTERKRAESEINRLAYYDVLTGLPNRQLLMELLEKAVIASRRTHQCGVLMFIDLDDFKTFNDTQGHSAGDVLLKKVARRLNQCVRAGDVVARLGGDEFVVILQGLGEDSLNAMHIAEGVARNLHLALAQPISVGSLQHHCTLSIGIAGFEESTMAADNVLRHADLAMYQAKAAGRNTLRFFDQDMQRAANERHAMESELRHALSNGQMSVFAQPQVSADGRVVGAELLLRWYSPTRGPVSPAAFIPLAEHTGLILPLGGWVMQSACHALAGWTQDPAMAGICLSVNASVREFSDPDFVPRTLGMLAEAGVAPGRLKVEVTESLLAEDIGAVTEKMAALRQAGVRLSIDDFGTGYSSLGYLRHMPLDEIKIDRSFVDRSLTSESDAAIVQIIITLAESFGLSVVAEGVETQAHVDFLTERGCGYLQGYFFSRPVPLAEFEAWVRARAG